MKKVIYCVICIVCITLIFSSCQTANISKEKESAIKVALMENRTADALSALKAEESAYGDNTSVYNLDLGLLSFYNGDYKAAIAALKAAEEEIEYNRITSVKEGLQGLIANDNVKAYSGANYEDLWVKGIKALSFYNLGDYDGAMVEIRRANIITQDFKLNPDKTGASGLEKAVLFFTPSPYQYFVDSSGKVYTAEYYGNSPLINYLSMVMYRGSGDIGNAEVDYRSLSGNRAVSSEEIEVPRGKARVNFLALNGLIAGKEEVSVMAPSAIGYGVYHKVAWPKIREYTGSAVQEVIVKCSNGQSISLNVLEDVSDAARNNVTKDAVSKYLGSYYRGETKISAAKVAADATLDAAKQGADALYSEAMKAAASQNPVFKAIAEVAAKKAYEASIDAAKKAWALAFQAINDTEIADVRMGRFLPDQVMAGGMTLDPGTYDFTIIYRTSHREIVREYKAVEISNKKPNIIVSLCAE